MLLGPLSETISSVSFRSCAFAGDHTAGADTALAAATADCGLQKIPPFHVVSGFSRTGRDIIPVHERDPEWG